MANQNETKGQPAPLGLFNIAYSEIFCKKIILIKNEPKHIITSKTQQAPFSPTERPKDDNPWAFVPSFRKDGLFRITPLPVTLP